jgi:hypothetical protein
MTTCFIISPSVRGVHAAGDRAVVREPVRASVRVPGIARDIQVKIATERHEFKQAFEILAANYRARGYEAPGEKPYRFTAYHALPGTATVVAVEHDRVVATFSIVADSELLGFPMESIYSDEIARLRRDGYRPAEVISLADQGLGAREFVQVLKAMMKLGIHHGLRHGVDCWVISVNPRHSGFYRKALGFMPLGPQRSYPTVRNHPAEAHVLTVASLESHAPKVYRDVFAEAIPDPALAGHRWSREHVRYFGSRSSQIDEPTLEKLIASVSGVPSFSH